MLKKMKKTRNSFMHTFINIMYNLLRNFLYISYISLRILEYLITFFYFVGLCFACVRYKYYVLCKIAVDNIHRTNLFIILPIILSLCVAIFSMILSLNPDSSIMTLGNHYIKLFVQRTGYVFSLSIVFIIIFCFSKSQIINMYFICDLFFIWMAINILILLIQIYLLIYKGLDYQINNVRTDAFNSKDIISSVKNIEDMQRQLKEQINDNYIKEQGDYVRLKNKLNRIK